MPRVFSVRTGEHDDVIQVNEADLPSNARQDDVESTLEGGWCPF